MEDDLSAKLEQARAAMAEACARPLIEVSAGDDPRSLTVTMNLNVPQPRSLDMTVSLHVAEPDGSVVHDRYRYVSDAIIAYYQISGNGAGGSLHVVLDDKNHERRHVEHCLEWARVNGDIAGVALAEMLLEIPDTVRANMAANGWVYAPDGIDAMAEALETGGRG